MGIRDRPTSFHSPWQNGYVERLIGSVRRECTDHLIVFNAEHLQRIFAGYAAYYNEMRTHVSLGKDAPVTRPIERRGDIVAYPVLGGLCLLKTPNCGEKIEIFASPPYRRGHDHDSFCPGFPALLPCS